MNLFKSRNNKVLKNRSEIRMAFAQGLCAGPAMAGHGRPWPELYESEGIKPKLCSYRPVGGKSTLAHFFLIFYQKWKLEKLLGIRRN